MLKILTRRKGYAWILSMTLVFAGVVSANEGDKLSALIDAYWENELQEDPFSATLMGDHRYDDRVPAVSPQDQDRRDEEAKTFLERLRAIDRASLSPGDRLNAELLDFILSHRIALAAFDSWRAPFLADSGFHAEFSFIVDATPFSSQADYRSYLKRLIALPDYIDQNIANMRRGLEDGFTQPAAIMSGVLPSFDALARADVESHPFFAPFDAMPETIPAGPRMELRRDGRRILKEDVLPAFERAAAFMRNEYAPSARATVGAAALPNGDDYYAALVRYYTTLDDADADQIHELGLAEVARIRAEMDDVIARTGFEGAFDDFLKFLRTDEQFYADNAQSLLERAAWIAKDIDGRLPAFFGRLPRQPYSVEPVPPAIAPNYTTGRYIGAPLDAARGGQYWVNTYSLDKRPLYALPALTLHEAVPGHHLQIALALEAEGVPRFRQEFYPHAFGEGWALYAEKLGHEMGVYATPYEEFGRLSYEMWRACRLVIDTGLHAKGWTREQAIDYLASNTALSTHNVQTEVDRYIAWPGQALAYKMGELTILELRKIAERELGEGFDIRAFHDAVLEEGGLPLEILRQQIDTYIEEAR